VKVLFSAERAKKLQELLSARVLSELSSTPPLDFEKLKYVAAFDSAYSDSKQYAVVVLYDYSKRAVVERAYAVAETRVPYIPGLLAFREVPGYVRAYRKLHTRPQLILVDGHGLTHPRSFGIATHLGLVLGVPSVGVAKRHLYGEVLETSNGRKLIKARGLVVGEVIKHEERELYISIGYKIRLEDAVTLVKSLLVKGYSLPIPLYEADKYSKIIKREH
jgi:deoxyribonuclease V